MERTPRVSSNPIRYSKLLLIFESSLFESGRVKPVNYSEKYTLDNIAEGLRAIEERKTWGKAIVQIRPDDEPVRAKL